MQPFIAGEKPAIAEPYLLTSIAGHPAFSDLAALEQDEEAAALATRAAEFILADTADDIVKFPRKWTDDMYMGSDVAGPRRRARTR